jgi:hypothetical protein
VTQLPQNTKRGAINTLLASRAQKKILGCGLAVDPKEDLFGRSSPKRPPCGPAGRQFPEYAWVNYIMFHVPSKKI